MLTLQGTQTISLSRTGPRRVEARYRDRAQRFAIGGGADAWRCAEQIARWRCDEPSSDDVAALARELFQLANGGGIRGTTPESPARFRPSPL